MKTETTLPNIIKARAKELWDESCATLTKRSKEMWAPITMKTEHCKGAYAVHAACSGKQCTCKCHERRLYVVKVGTRRFVVNAGGAYEAEEAVKWVAWPLKPVSVEPTQKQVVEIK